MRIDRLSSDPVVGHRPSALKVDRCLHVELDLPWRIAVAITVDRE